ncbi:TetR/AcrR family transcriptional regulator [Comamonas humi]
MKTRERLLLTAERLIAEEGAGQVSLRRINAEAGARNLSAIHYHFGSLEGVITAIFEYRAPTVEQQRSHMLDELQRSGRQPSVEDVLRIAVWPLAATMLSDAADNHYVRFLSAINRVPQLDTWEVVPRRNRRSIIRCYLLLRRMPLAVPADILHLRIIMGLREMFHVLADVDHNVRERHPGLRDPLVVFHANELITRLMSALQAPVSEASQVALDTLRASAAPGKASVYGVDSILLPEIR